MFKKLYDPYNIIYIVYKNQKQLFVILFVIMNCYAFTVEFLKCHGSYNYNVFFLTKYK